MRGYRGIGPEAGKFIDETDSYAYAKEHLDEMPERDRELFVEFFFSGNWIKSE